MKNLMRIFIGGKRRKVDGKAVVETACSSATPSKISLTDSNGSGVEIAIRSLDCLTGNASSIGKDVVNKEIKGLHALAESLGNDFNQAVELIFACQGKVVVSGIGKSGHIARKIAATFASTGTPAFHLDAAEAGHGDLGVIGQDDVLLILSKSGGSRELQPLLSFASWKQIPIISMTFRGDSELAISASCCLLLPESEEVDKVVPAPTTSALMMLAMGDALATALWKSRGFDSDAFSILHPSGTLGLQLRKIKTMINDLHIAKFVAPDADLTCIAKAITTSGTGCALVGRDGGELLGIITDDHLRHALLRNERTAEAIMSRVLLRISPNDTAASALALMEKHQVSQLIVEGETTHVIHLQTLLRAQVVA